MKITASFVAPRVDFVKFLQDLQEVLGDALSKAAFEWLEATTAEIPTWSGASLATFQPLASQVGLSLSISPVTKSRIDVGLASATGSFETDAASGKFTFTYGTTLAHLIYNEFNNANISPDPSLFSSLKQPGPYRFQEKGREAFNRSVSRVRLPKPVYRLTKMKVQ